jgi:hypothetical protein
VTAFAVGFVLGALFFALLIHLDPGPGPRRLASEEEWRLHERRVARFRGWPLTVVLMAAGALTFIISAVGGWFEKAALGAILGMACIFAVEAVRRLTAVRRAR